MPVLLIGNTIWLLASPAFVQAQYVVRPPADVAMLSADAERELGESGARAIHPAANGVTALERARLENGQPVFSGRELAHMEDVGTLVSRVLSAWGIALFAGTAAIVVLLWSGRGGPAARAVGRGASLTLAGTLVLAVAMAISFGDAFDAFHGLLFAGNSWRFATSSTLLKLYPQTFWIVSGTTAVAVTVLQAVVIKAVLRRRGRVPADQPRPHAS